MKRSIIVLVVAAAVLAVGFVQSPVAEAKPNLGPIDWVENPVQDTYVVQGEDIVLGREPYLRGGLSNKSEYRMLIQFDFPPEMGDDSVIEAATLRLWCYEAEELESSRPKLEVREPNKKWEEDKTNWNNKPNPAGGGQDWEIFEEDCDAPGGEWVSIDVLEYVERWYDGSRNNHGFYILPENLDKDDMFRFQAKDHASPYPRGNQPQLVLRFIPPPSPTPPPTDTPTPSSTPTASNTPTVTDTPSATDTPTTTPTSTATPTPTPPPPVFMPLSLRAFDLLSGGEPEEPESGEAVAARHRHGWLERLLRWR